jgi:hypothetical protein
MALGDQAVSAIQPLTVAHSKALARLQLKLRQTKSNTELIQLMESVKTKGVTFRHRRQKPLTQFRTPIQSRTATTQSNYRVLRKNNPAALFSPFI